MLTPKHPTGDPSASLLLTSEKAVFCKNYLPELRPWMAWRVLASSGSPGSRFVHLYFLVKARPRSNPLSKSRSNSLLLTKFSSSSRSCRSKSSVDRLPSSDGPQSSVEQAFRCAEKSYQKFDPFPLALVIIARNVIISEIYSLRGPLLF